MASLRGLKIGPFGFKLYTTRLYLLFDPQNSKFAMRQIEACIIEIKSWMGSNFLKLNDEKVWLWARLESSARVYYFCWWWEGEAIQDSGYIGALLDSTLTMIPHTNSITRSCYFQIRNLSRIRKYLFEESSKTLTHAFVSSWLHTTLCCIKPCRHWQKDFRTFKTMQQELWRNRGNPVILHLCYLISIGCWLNIGPNIRYYSWFTKAYMVRVQPTWHQLVRKNIEIGLQSSLKFFKRLILGILCLSTTKPFTGPLSALSKFYFIAKNSFALKNARFHGDILSLEQYN